MQKTKAGFLMAIQDNTNQQLEAKVKLGQILCNFLVKDEDERASKAIERLELEQQWIVEVLEERGWIKQKVDNQNVLISPDKKIKPMAQVIGLKPLELIGKTSL